MLAGFKVDATTLSTDLIKVGPSAYLAEMNTFEHLGDLSTYNLMNRRNYDMGRLQEARSLWTFCMFLGH